MPEPQLERMPQDREIADQDLRCGLSGRGGGGGGHKPGLPSPEGWALLQLGVTSSSWEGIPDSS